MNFSDIPVVQPVKDSMIRVCKNKKVPHAQLFSGVDGGVALPLSLAYIQYLLCENPENDSCNQCLSCKRIEKGIHPDVHYFFPQPSFTESTRDEKKRKAQTVFKNFIQQNPFQLFKHFVETAEFFDKNLLISKEDSKKIVEIVKLKTASQKYKIILIWMPEYFHPSAANALLKVLEEPPQNTVFLLVSHDPNRVLQTLQSRCLCTLLPPIAEVPIQSFLMTHKHLESAEAAQIAQLANGSIGAALDLIDGTQDSMYENFRLWMLNCLNAQYDLLIEKATQFANLDRLKQQTLMRVAMQIISGTLKNANPNSPKPYHEDEFIKKFGNFLSEKDKLVMYEECNHAAYHLERNANPKMTHFHLSSVFIPLFNNKA